MPSPARMTTSGRRVTNTEYPYAAMVPMATRVFMFASPCRAPFSAATRKRRPKTNCTMVAGTRNQRLMSAIGHGAPPGQNMTAIITAPMASDASAWRSSVPASARRSRSTADSASAAVSAAASRPTS